ncbi:DUF1573 domain-containing protein [Flavobacteriales bacterium]|jgi:hypothetical protein|nr:DUF1573 domain-containing protein [Flavobacteriales bacterium]|tara:strand:- start:3266 stop:3718 length:453 start_codon:yes stop_codon:yes gene_type:complete
MKKYYYMLIAGIICFTNISCDNNPTKKINQQNLLETEKRLEQESVLPILKFDFDTYDFGEVTDGEIVEVDYTFKNTGESNLIIYDASASCGCTVPEYPKDKEIKPGESGVIKARFDSSGQTGKQVKSITLTTNTKNSKKIIRMSGFVINK